MARRDVGFWRALVHLCRCALRGCRGGGISGWEGEERGRGRWRERRDEMKDERGRETAETERRRSVGRGVRRERG